jgi:DNA-binding CsgD family transcriptional regulator
MANDPFISEKIRTLLEAVEILHGHENADFAERTISACQHVFPETFNGFELWSLADGSYEGEVNAPFDEATRAERLRRIAEVLPKDNPAFAAVVAGAREPLLLSDFITQRQLRLTEYFDLALKPLGIRHQVAIPILTGTHAGGVVFNKGGQRDFTKEDMDLIRQLGRHIVLAHRTAQALAAAEPQKARVKTTDHLMLRRAGLSRRESEVLLWVAEGKRDKEIALILGISYRTVTDHVRAILAKLQVETRTAAVVAARRLETR